jgi:hypothetical protein
MSGRIHKSRIPLKRLSDLPDPARESIIESKNRVRQEARLEPFGNEQGGPGDGPPLPTLSRGCEYVEFQVGRANAGDARQAGRWRVVFELHMPSRQILNTYFTYEHYEKFTFYRIV